MKLEKAATSRSNALKKNAAKSVAKSYMAKAPQ